MQQVKTTTLMSGSQHQQADTQLSQGHTATATAAVTVPSDSADGQEMNVVQPNAASSAVSHSTAAVKPSSSTTTDADDAPWRQLRQRDVWSVHPRAHSYGCILIAHMDPAVTLTESSFPSVHWSQLRFLLVQRRSTPSFSNIIQQIQRKINADIIEHEHDQDDAVNAAEVDQQDEQQRPVLEQKEEPTEPIRDTLDGNNDAVGVGAISSSVTSSTNVATATSVPPPDPTRGAPTGSSGVTVGVSGGGAEDPSYHAKPLHWWRREVHFLTDHELDEFDRGWAELWHDDSRVNDSWRNEFMDANMEHGRKFLPILRRMTDEERQKRHMQHIPPDATDDDNGKLQFVLPKGQMHTTSSIQRVPHLRLQVDSSTKDAAAREVREEAQLDAEEFEVQGEFMEGSEEPTATTETTGTAGATAAATSAAATGGNNHSHMHTSAPANHLAPISFGRYHRGDVHVYIAFLKPHSPHHPSLQPEWRPMPPNAETRRCRWFSLSEMFEFFKARRVSPKTYTYVLMNKFIQRMGWEMEVWQTVRQEEYRRRQERYQQQNGHNHQYGHHQQHQHHPQQQYGYGQQMHPYQPMMHQQTYYPSPSSFSHQQYPYAQPYPQPPNMYPAPNMMYGSMMPMHAPMPQPHMHPYPNAAPGLVPHPTMMPMAMPTQPYQPMIPGMYSQPTGDQSAPDASSYQPQPK